ncbi:MAG: chemotaxis protein CheB, partial [Planctomycetota bacterium]
MGGKSYAGGAGIGLTHVVGVGASAGGLEALERLFDGVEPDSGMAYVVVQHLSPDFKSLMDELLARHTRMPIFKATDGVRVEPNTIYLMPPKTEMIISGGRLLLKDKEPSNGLSLPIDRFFRSLAQEAGEAAVAVVLSGTGTDGSRGVREVSECGGLVIAQSVETAQFDGMPQSAIDTDCVDYVLPPDLIGDALRRHALGQPPRPAEGDDPADPMLRVFSLLRERYSLDFSSYKVTSVSRRIQRRLGLLEEESLEDYVGRLAHDPAELEALYRDLLIG